MELSAKEVRKRILTMGYNCGRSVHVGGSLSMVELLTVLYRDIIKYDANNPEWEDRDRFILSKGHCVLALYAVLAECGVLSQDDVDSFMQDGSHFGSHPVMDVAHGIECSSGSLGQGISFAVGTAKAIKMKKKSNKVYTMIGNGEMNEGSVWEALMLAQQWKLDNLVIILDNNKMQSDGESSSIISCNELRNTITSLGFHVEEIDGHNEEEILSAFSSHSGDRAKFIIANTIKGKGVSFMENNNDWHHNRLIKKQYEIAIKENEG